MPPAPIQPSERGICVCVYIYINYTSPVQKETVSRLYLRKTKLKQVKSGSSYKDFQQLFVFVSNYTVTCNRGKENDFLVFFFFLRSLLSEGTRY
jgi:hypothetical protein